MFNSYSRDLREQEHFGILGPGREKETAFGILGTKKKTP
jgi:hypothetical protein